MNHIFTSWIFRVNVVFLTLSLFFLFAPIQGDESRFFRLIVSSFLLVVIFVLPSINFTAILSRITKSTFDPVELFSITTVFSLLLVPLLLTLETDFFHILSPQLPLLNAALSFALFSFFFKSNKKNTIRQAHLLEPNQPHAFSYAISFLISFAIIATTIFSIVTAYYPLPDLDPYYWIKVFQDQFSRGVISSLTSHRPLFSSLTYLFNQSAGVDLYAFFKYLVPFFALLPIVPAILIARRFPEKILQTSIFLIPIVNGSFFLYSTMPIPQSIFNSVLIAAIFFALHGLLSEKKLYFLLTGAILFLGFFYHEMSAIPLFAWILSWILFERKNIVDFAKKNRLVSWLIFIIIATNLSLFTPILFFVFIWIKKITAIIVTSSPNFYFPAKYINIDGNDVGWQGLFGVVQYYAFYFGPAALLVVFSFIFFGKIFSSSSLFRQRESFFLLTSLFIFFLISDIFPRLFNIALLPERSLGFASLFILSLLPLLFLSFKNIRGVFAPLFPFLIIGALCINIGAALYINTLKSYLITPAQLISAQWIRTNLPANRVIFSSENHRLLTFYSNSTVADITDLRFYSDKTIAEKILRLSHQQKYPNTATIQKQLKVSSDALADLSNSSQLLNVDFQKSLQVESARLTDTIRLVETELQSMETQKNTQILYYIYHAAPSKKNPYANRPYMQSENNQPTSFIFDQYPERFRMIYSDKENEIYLWEVL